MVASKLLACKTKKQESPVHHGSGDLNKQLFFKYSSNELGKFKYNGNNFRPYSCHLTDIFSFCLSVCFGGEVV